MSSKSSSSIWSLIQHYLCNPVAILLILLDEWSARRRILYLTTHNTPNRQTSMAPAGFEPTIPASERLRTDALDRVATGIGLLYSLPFQNILCVSLNHEVCSGCLDHSHLCQNGRCAIGDCTVFVFRVPAAWCVAYNAHVYTRYRCSVGVREHVNTGDLHCVTLHTLLPPLRLWGCPLCGDPLPTL